MNHDQRRTQPDTRTPIADDTRTPAAGGVVVGVDTHKDSHRAVVPGSLGRRLGARSFPADDPGYWALERWAASHGPVECYAVESTGSYGAALTRSLTRRGAKVVEINRPHRYTRARVGKDDTVDAEAAARKAQSGRCTTVPKDTTGAVESIRVLTVARDSAVGARAHDQIRDLLVTAPQRLRDRITALRTKEARAAACRRLPPPAPRHRRPPTGPTGPPGPPCAPRPDASTTWTPRSPTSTPNSTTWSPAPPPP